MDSLSQIALGSAVGIAVMGRRTALWKAALWGGVVGTLPDLDAFIDHGDPISNMTLHRAETHAVFWQTLASPPIAAAIAALHREWPLWRRWCVAVWLALVTHALLDTMTVYGTQLALPFSDHPFAVGSVFIIDPLYTLPLAAGVIAALRAGAVPRALRRNAAGLVASSAYLAWGVLAQAHVDSLARRSLAAQGIAAERVLVTPTAFNSLLWRVVAMTRDGYHEGYRSLLDREPRISFEQHARGNGLEKAVGGQWHVARLAWFSHGFFRLQEDGGQVRIADLRMGQEPYYTFNFIVAEDRDGTLRPLLPPRLVGARPDLGRGFAWLGRRMLGDPLPSPR